MTKVMKTLSAIMVVNRTQEPQPPEELVSESNYILFPASFSSLYDGNNRRYSLDCFHSFNKYLLSINHMPGTVLGVGNTVINMIITTCLMELTVSLSGCHKTHIKRGVLQTSKNYTIMKYYCSSSIPQLG